MPTPEQITSVAGLLLDTPFAHQGRLPGVGLDCAGVAIAVCQALGYPVVDRTDYGRTPHQGALEAQIAAQPFLERHPAAEARPGDFLLIRFGAEPQHIAILTSAGTLIHAYETVGKVVEQRYGAMWQKHTVAAWRFREGC